MSSLIDRAKDTIAENFGGSFDKLASHQFSLDSDTPDLSGKVAVVTGGAEGVGYGITHTLLKHGVAKLFILSVSKDVVSGSKEAVAREMDQATANRIVWMKCDLSDWTGVKDVSDKIKNSTDRLDILVNNAGRGIMSYELTDYGVDRHMAVNHMGHVVLTSHLLPLMKKTAESTGGGHSNFVRIVNLASNMHQSVPDDLQFASLDELNTDLGPNQQYGRSKLAGMLYARYFDCKVTKNGHPNVLMNATHPGMLIFTIRSYPLAGYGMSVGLEPFKKNQFEGAMSTVFAATKITGSGQYICPPAVPEPGSKASQASGSADGVDAQGGYGQDAERVGGSRMSS
ncbi:retinol dehydrogenase 12 [Penicillium brevicompactum]|uniref:retinol dehydrogenase 12 n=1 Tax=Penicillium brevicompactum TaxID=5074 RepID=UPI002541ABB8|nr:retinol dehydrogenase 12 [Penicillium brevicompactum]KAJ5337445.1 retinol dehydrogenase 12 [Penicillium brevicompactum]